MSIETVQGRDAANLERPRKRDWREFVREEAKSFAVIFVYLAIVFGVLGLHQWIVLSSKGIDYQFYGLALLNALVSAKVILVAEGFNFADSLKTQPLAYRVLYKCLAFTALLVVAYMAEEVLVGKLHGEGAGPSLSADRRRDGQRLARHGCHIVRRPHSVLRVSRDGRGNRSADVEGPLLYR